MGRNRCSAGQLAESGGTADWYVRTGPEPKIDTVTLDDIEHDVPVRGWRQVAAHVTVGSARCTDLTAIEAEALELVMFSPAELNVCHHGNNGTATNHLKRWTV